MKVDIWKLYKKFFKDGEYVCIFTNDGKFDVGKLKTDERAEELILTFPKQAEHHYSFYDICFMSHDGFPAKLIRGGDHGSLEKAQAIRRLFTLDKESTEHEEIECGICGNRKRGTFPDNKLKNNIQTRFDAICDDCVVEGKKPKVYYKTDISIGHPLMIEGVCSILLNPGRTADYDEDGPFSETVLCQSQEGAIGMLWGLDAINELVM